MDNKGKAITFGIIAGVLLIAGAIVTWKYMQLRKNVAKVATGTATPTGAATTAAINTINAQAANVTA